MKRDYFINRKTVKCIFQSIAVGYLSLSILGCTMAIGLTRGEKEYYKFCNELRNDRRSIIKGKTLYEVDPSFWSQADTIPVAVSKSRIIAIGIGGVDYFETAKLFFAGGLVGGLVCGPGRGQDSSFGEKINKFSESYSWQIDDYFFELFKKGTTLSIERETSEVSAMNNKFLQPKGEILKIGKRNIIAVLSFVIISNKPGGSGWGKPRYRLKSKLGITAATDEALQSFKNRFQNILPPTINDIDMWFNAGKKDAGTELRRVSAYPGMYRVGIYKYSPYCSKEQWLSDNGAFLEKELKSAITYLAKEADRTVLITQEKNR